METSFCERGHEVWWADLNEKRVAFVRFTRGYDLAADPRRPSARALRHCWRLHSDICDCREFTPPRRAFWGITSKGELPPSGGTTIMKGGTDDR